MSNNRDKMRNVAPIRLELLVTIVPKSKGAFYVDLIQSFDVNMQVSVPAQGTADRELLHFLGLTDTDKTVDKTWEIMKNEVNGDDEQE